MVTSVGGNAVRRAQRAGECGVGSAQRKDDVTDASDDVSTVSVEFDVLIIANGGEAELLDCDEVAVSNDPCSNCIGIAVIQVAGSGAKPILNGDTVANIVAKSGITMILPEN